MFINNLDFVDTPSKKSITGAASASASGHTFATYGFASADGSFNTNGDVVFSSINTKVSTHSGSSFAFSHGSVNVQATAADQNNLAAANYKSHSNFTQFKGSSYSSNTSFSTQFSSCINYWNC